MITTQLSSGQINCLWCPVGKDLDYLIGLGGIIRLEVQAEIMLPTHPTVHHVLHPYRSSLTWVEDHRTDGRIRRSTALRNFNRRLFDKS
jgi:hypothetical protein